MIDLVLTVMISALSLAQPGQAAITTNELAPPPGMSGTGTPTPSLKQEAPSKGAKAAARKSTSEKSAAPPETRSQAPAEDAKDVGIDNATQPGDAATAAPAPSGTEAAQPTSEERQAPTSKQANGSGGPGRVAAFWFILPNRPPENK